MPAWVAIAEREGGDAEELPTEKDGSLLLASLTNHYPSVTTLKYKGLSGIWRIVRCVDGILTPPDDDGSWGSHVYICIKKKETPKEYQPSGAEGTRSPPATPSEAKSQQC